MSKEAQKIRSRRWYLANREKALARAKQQREEDHEGYLAYLKARYDAIPREVRKAAASEWHANNRERNLARMSAYRAKDKEETRKRDADKYVKRKEAVLARCAEYYSENRDSVKSRVRIWAKNNPIAVSALRRNRRARLRNAIGSHNAQDIERIMSLQKSRCAFCKISFKGIKWHVDHIMPLKLGGSNAPANLQILCVPCNSSKSAKHPVDFARQRGLLL